MHIVYKKLGYIIQTINHSENVSETRKWWKRFPETVYNNFETKCINFRKKEKNKNKMYK